LTVSSSSFLGLSGVTGALGSPSQAQPLVRRAAGGVQRLV